MEEARDRLFDLGSENISDGLPFLQLGKIKEDTEAGLVVVGQNRKGFNLNSPYLRVVWFHQKVVRVYVVKGFRMVDPRKLYVEVRLEEDWVWRDLPLRQAPDIFGGPASIKDTEILIPGAYYVEKVKPNDWTNLLMKSEQYDVFVAPSDYYGDKCLFKTYRKQLIIDLPPETKEQPHLFKHTAFQFCFLRDIVFSTNLLYMDIDQDNKIRATVDIYASPAGTYFIFKSGEIPFK
ncbi:17614_t:CDS:2 [Funneliformis geosporum]|nr:17614_t:CDS:2 [Funneliformis geosporum]